MKKLVLSIAVFAAAFSFAQKTSTKKAQPTTKKPVSTEAKAKESLAEKEGLPKPYHPEEDAEQRISELIVEATSSKKNIIIQAGGNWCIWCLRFEEFINTNPELKSIVDNKILYYHLNFSPENKNEEIFARYGNPGEKLGYPVFIVLNPNGDIIHIQESSVLEEGKGYSLDKVLDFFHKWQDAS